MNVMRFLPAMCLLLLVGCQSDHSVSGVTMPDQSHPVVSASPVSTTNIYYMIDNGPGCAIFFKQSDFGAFFGPDGEGKLVTVVDGHFPPPTQKPISPTLTGAQFCPPLNYNIRDMSLIDDTGTK